MNKKQKIERLLSHGKENAITCNDLMKFFPKASKRDILAQIRKERNSGVTILAQKNNGGGFFLPANQEEVSEYLELLNKSIQSQKETYEAIEASAYGEKKKSSLKETL